MAQAHAQDIVKRETADGQKACKQTAFHISYDESRRKVKAKSVILISCSEESRFSGRFRKAALRAGCP
ncbi:hypothetical protein EVA_05851 [gut metagenome]|uniref:Uncharacterized protein n=1 Tax=gut metagenome TaxID=749906 RepID=J9D0H4_9ZZZZ